MDTPSDALVEKKKLPVRRETPMQAAIRPEKKRNRWITPLLVCIAFFVGAGLTVVVMRQRGRAREVVLSVNGVVINKDAFFGRLERASGVPVIRAIVNEELSMQFAKQQNVPVTDAQVADQVAEASKNPNFKDQLAQSGQSLDDYKKTARLNLARFNVITKGITVTEADTRKFYDMNVDKKNPEARYYTPETASIAVIITPTEAEGQKALSDLTKGVSFATVAQTYSKDDSKKNGGMLPTFPRGRRSSSKIPGLEDTIFGMKFGEQIGPRKFAGAWWIIRCVDKKPEVTVSFDKIKEECRKGAMLLKGLANAQKTEQAFTDFQKSSNIQAFWTQYAEAVKTK